MYTLNDKIKTMTPYEPITGTYKIRLDANESCISLSNDIIEQFKQAIGQIDYNRYPDPYAAKLCVAFADYYGIDANMVTAGNGSDELISVIINSFLQKNEKLLVIDPDFSMYQFYGELSESQVVKILKNDDLTIDVDTVIDTANREKVRAICFSNPCNPTSLGLSKDHVRKIITSVNALVILDEAYMDFWNESLLSEVGDYDNLLILKTCSKAIGFAAVRLGFAIAGKTITQALRAAKSPYNVNSVSQTMGTVLLQNKQYLQVCRKNIINSRKDLAVQINQLNDKTNLFNKVYESCTNFVFIKTDKAKTIYEEMLKRSIAIRFMGAYLRISAGLPQENSEVIKALEEIAQANL